jgi:predicted lipoprotein
MAQSKKCLSVLGFLLVFALLSGCSGSSKDPSPGENNADRKEVLIHWADKIIIPAYDEFKTHLEAMVSKANAFTNAPDNTTLTEFRTAWSTAYHEWQKVEPFEFGPADKYTIRAYFNIYPADVPGIQAAINAPETNLALSANIAKQGFPALDYLINGTGDDDAAVIAFYTTDPNAAANKAYLTKLVQRMSTLLNNVVTEWPSYRETFISKTSSDIGSSLGLVVNAYVLHYERYIRTGKIGIPSGATIASGGVAYPEKIESYYHPEISLALAKQAHQATFDFFSGKDAVTGEEGPSFKSFLDALDAKDTSTGTALSTIITNQFQTKLDDLGPNLYEEAQQNNQAMLDTHAEMQTLVRMLKVDMTSALSVTITYTDNDGD